MPLASKTRLGPYEIIAPLGAGGMGEVYKGRDTRLDRTVAIKICKGRFTDRFEREARAISSLNHQHICALYDIGHEDSMGFLVMEHLEGETLEARLRHGALPIAEALQIAIEIAGALDAAHRKGVIHRDLKPGNVMLTSAGAKLLDFGLAKFVETTGTPSGIDAAPSTVTQTITAEGTILGTFQYMSPEQLEGKESDARSDIFSFGAMLYETIAGSKAFRGASQASLMAAVMSTDPPPVSTAQPMASPALDRVIRMCLAKSPDDRWQSARDLLNELRWIADSGSQAGIAAAAAVTLRSRQRLPWLVAGAVSALFLASLVFTVAHLREQPARTMAVRFEMPAPDNLSWYDLPAVSPDGERIAFTAGTETNKLFVRPLNASAATPLPVQGGAYGPFWSPDGRQIAYFTATAVQKVDAAGGPPFTLCQTPSASIGGTWNRDGVIVVSLGGLLHRLAATGGEPKPLRPLAEGETAQRWPQFLPDGKHYLYLSVSSRPDLQGIYAASLDGGERKRIVASDANAWYVPSGQLLYMRGDVLMAQPFDLRKLLLQGEPHPIADHIVRTVTAPGAIFAASSNGVLVWRSGNGSDSLLEWFDRSGKKLGAVGDAADFSNPALSPDDGRLAVGIRDPQTKTRDIWVIDLMRGARTRLTFDPADELNPVWSPDGTRIAFSSNRRGERDVYQKLADGLGQDELLLEAKDGQDSVEDWSADGKYLLYHYQPPEHNYLYVMPFAGDRKPVPLVKTELHTEQGQFSPNGRWLAYSSYESRKSDIYVQGFTPSPSRPRGKWQVSTAGGSEARWRRDGKELYYYSGGAIMAVDVKTDGASFEAGIPKALFKAPPGAFGARNHFVVSKDGQRFLVVTPVEETTNTPMQVLVNWR
jgi:Tol biopolymer transport system component/tRNA A-37 threonylcarbamoyl transferase component Bud32